MAASGALARLRGASLETKLILFSTLLTILAVGATFAALSLEIRRQTRRLLADTLEQHQRMLLDVQGRDRETLLWLSRLMTESPTLRAAMETYQSERGPSSSRRPDLLATIQTEAERIAGGLERDLLVVTDDQGSVLAAKSRVAASVAIGDDLSRATVVRRALEETSPLQPGGFAVEDVGGRPFQMAGVPILLQGYPIGALALGDALDSRLADRLHETLASDVVIVRDGKVLAATLPGTLRPGSDAAAEGGALQSAGHSEGGASLVTIGSEEYVAAALPLAAGGSGGRATIYLLHSLTQALGPSNRTLLETILIYGTIAAGLAGLAAWIVSRSILRPLESFVAFLREVTASGDRDRTFALKAAGPEVATLSETYARLMESLRDHERRRLQEARAEIERVERLKESEKLAALGRMLSGAAHEINNPLTGVIGNLDLLLADARLDSQVRGRLDCVRREGQRIVALVRNLLKTAHRDTGQRSIVDLNALVRDTAGLRQHDFTSAGMRLALQLTDAKCRVLASELELQQVVLNVVNNAYDALKEGIRGAELVVRTAAIGDEVTVEFLDNGPGMREPQRVFDHFYTTKEVGKGTGLGLSISHAIIEHHGGRLLAENRREGGARFVLRLPALAHETQSAAPEARSAAHGARGAAAPASSATGSRATAPAAGGRPIDSLPVSVLVVDDEPSVLDLQLTILETVGAQATGARSGSEAIEYLKLRDFDLVVSDIKMPGQISGQDLFVWVQKNKPAMARGFVFVTGDTVAEGTQAFLEGTRRRYVQKPFSIDHYLATLRETYDARQAA